MLAESEKWNATCKRAPKKQIQKTVGFQKVSFLQAAAELMKSLVASW
jgi:hypothetical protein